MKMRVEAFTYQYGCEIPKKYTCDGKEISPGISWQEAPEGTKSFAILMLGLDTPSLNKNTPRVLWLVYNITAETCEIKTGTLPDGAQIGTNDLGKAKYSGPCPKPGPDHQRYEIRLYALDKTLDLEDGASVPDFFDAIKGHVLGKAIKTATYERYKK